MIHLATLYCVLEGCRDKKWDKNMTLSVEYGELDNLYFMVITMANTRRGSPASE